MAFKEFNTDIGIQGKISLTTVPNKAGTLLTYGSEGDISTRTNAQIISDLGLISATNIASSYYTKIQLQTSGQSQVHWGNITSKPTSLFGYGITNAHEVDRTGGLNNVSDTHRNQSWFDYSWADTGKLGSVISFGGLNDLYNTEFFGRYNGDGNEFGARTRNGDVNIWNPIRWFWHSGNFQPTDYVPYTGANQSVNLGSNNLVANTGVFKNILIDNQEAYGSISFARNGPLRWFFTLDPTPEDGNDNGSELSIYRYNNNGDFLGRAMGISRSTGNVTFENRVTAQHSVVAGGIALGEVIGKLRWTRQSSSTLGALAEDNGWANIQGGVIYTANHGDSSQWNTAFGWGNHAGKYVGINSSRFADFGYEDVALADFDILPTAEEGKLKLDGWYAINVGALANHGTRLTVVGKSTHDKTQLYFNGENGFIQYRKSWYSNSAWTELRTLWDSNNLTKLSQLTNDSGYSTQTWVNTNFIPKSHPIYNVTTANINTWNDAYNKQVVDFTKAFSSGGDIFRVYRRDGSMLEHTSSGMAVLDTRYNLGNPDGDSNYVPNGSSQEISHKVTPIFHATPELGWCSSLLIKGWNTTFKTWKITGPADVNDFEQDFYLSQTKSSDGTWSKDRKIWTDFNLRQTSINDWNSSLFRRGAFTNNVDAADKARGTGIWANEMGNGSGNINFPRNDSYGTYTRLHTNSFVTELMGYNGSDLYYKTWYTADNPVDVPWRKIWDNVNLPQSALEAWNTAVSWGNHANAGYITSSALSPYAQTSWVNTNFIPKSGGGVTGMLDIVSSGQPIKFRSTAQGANYSTYSKWNTGEPIGYIGADGGAVLGVGDGSNFVVRGTNGLELHSDTGTVTANGSDILTLGNFGVNNNYPSGKAFLNRLTVGELAWRNYGNGHTITDVSNGLSPSGGAVNRFNADNPWQETFPMLVGWNGGSTYGVRVDSARIADTVVGIENYLKTSYLQSKPILDANIITKGTETNYFGGVNGPPTATDGNIITTAYSESFANQIFMNWANQMHFRTKSSGVWADWKEVWTTQNLPKSAIDYWNNLESWTNNNFSKLSHNHQVLYDSGFESGNSASLDTLGNTSNFIIHQRVQTGAPSLFPNTNNANALMSIGTHPGYSQQIGFSSDGNLYRRSMNSNIWETTWKKIYDTGNFNPANFVNVTGNQTIAGMKEFTDRTTIHKRLGLKNTAGVEKIIFNSDQSKIVVRQPGGGSAEIVLFGWDETGPFNYPSLQLPPSNSTLAVGCFMDKYVGYNLQVGGSARMGGSILIDGTYTGTAFYESSLRKLKENIQPFEKSGLDLVNELDIVTYDRIDGTKDKIGIIADDTRKEFLSEEMTEVDLYKTIFIQAKAIQELTARIEALENK